MFESNQDLEEEFYICGYCSELYNDQEAEIYEDKDGCTCFKCIEKYNLES